MNLDRKFGRRVKSSLAGAVRRRARLVIAVTTALTLGVLGLVISLTAHAAPSVASFPLWGTLDTQPSTVAAEAGSSAVSGAMLEFNWASFEPTNGVLSSSYLATMKYELASYQAAGMKVTLGLGLQNTPSWVFALRDARYVDQKGNTSTEANFVFSQAVRSATASYLSLIAKAIPLSSFWAIRLTSGGDGEMLYPGGGTYWGFDPAALTGSGLAAGLTRNPYPRWRPGTAGLTQAQIAIWVNWYIGAMGNVTNWQINTLARLGFTGYYEPVTPGSGTRPDYLAATERANLSNDGTTGVGAVWNLYYSKLANKANVIAYVSSVADNSGGNDSCTASDAALPLTSNTMDSWSATRWITRIAGQYGLQVGGENPGYGIPASLDSFYTNTSSTGMMATAIRMATSCKFKVFYWAHDIHLQDGTLPFSFYAASIAPYSTAPVNLALTGTVAASSATPGFPAGNANDSDLSSYWQAATATATATLHLAAAAPVDRVIAELPKDWGTRTQVIEVDGSTNGATWTTLAPAATYTFVAGSSAVAIPVRSATWDYLRLDVSGNSGNGTPQIAEFQAYSY